MNMPWSAPCDTCTPTRSETALPGAPQDAPPLVLRYPANGKARGIVVFCHGLGSSGRAYGDLTDCWVRQGFVVIHPTFADSIFEVAKAFPDLSLDPTDESLVLWVRTLPHVRPHMLGILHDPAYWLDRVRIVQGIVEGLPAILSGTGIDPTDLPLGIAGHSFGAHTTQLLAGAEIDLPEGPKNFRDTRFAAALVLSGQGRDQQGLREGSWDGSTGPVLTVTGKKDGGAKGQDWRWKCEPFELAPPGGKMLAVLGDANHYLGGMTPEGSVVPVHFDALKQVTAAFLEAQLLDSPGARAWLDLIEDQIGQCPVIVSRK